LEKKNPLNFQDGQKNRMKALSEEKKKPGPNSGREKKRSNGVFMSSPLIPQRHGLKERQVSVLRGGGGPHGGGKGGEGGGGGILSNWGAVPDTAEG